MAPQDGTDPLGRCITVVIKPHNQLGAMVPLGQSPPHQGLFQARQTDTNRRGLSHQSPDPPCSPQSL